MVSEYEGTRKTRRKDLQAEWLLQTGFLKKHSADEEEDDVDLLSSLILAQINKRPVATRRQHSRLLMCRLTA